MKTHPVASSVCRWTARVLGLLLIAFVIMMAIGEGLPNPFRLSPLELLGFAGLLCLLGGLVLAWFRELPGGLISLAGLAMIVGPTAVHGRVTWFFLVMATPALLSLAAAALRPHKPLGPATRKAE